jgi:hypothetical protein
MKFILAGAAFAAASFAALAPCRAQYVVVTQETEPPRVELAPMLGYAFANGVEGPAGSVDVEGSPTFGGTAALGDWLGVHLLLAYLLQETAIGYQPYDAPTQSLYDLSLHHFQMGAEFDILPGQVRPFIGFTLGAALFVPHAGLPNELWFESSLEGGAKILFTRDLGIRAQVQLTSVFLDASSQIFCGSGCYVPWYGTGISTTQVGLSVGPVLAF